jgi:hypothetical protein
MPLDNGSLKKALRRLVDQSVLHDGEFWAIVYGRFETRNELQVALAPDGVTVLRDGFGHLNVAPAQIVVKKADIKIITEAEAKAILK